MGLRQVAVAFANQGIPIETQEHLVSFDHLSDTVDFSWFFLWLVWSSECEQCEHTWKTWKTTFMEILCYMSSMEILRSLTVFSGRPKLGGGRGISSFCPSWSRDALNFSVQNQAPPHHQKSKKKVCEIPLRNQACLHPLANGQGLRRMGWLGEF